VEIESTTVVAVDLAECSAKVRTGPPLDPVSDRGLRVWAGEIPSGWSPEPPARTPI